MGAFNRVNRKTLNFPLHQLTEKLKLFHIKKKNKLKLQQMRKLNTEYDKKHIIDSVLSKRGTLWIYYQKNAPTETS